VFRPPRTRQHEAAILTLKLRTCVKRKRCIVEPALISMVAYPAVTIETYQAWLQQNAIIGKLYAEQKWEFNEGDTESFSTYTHKKSSCIYRDPYGTAPATSLALL
jgi:hypothetical protein